MVTLLFDEDSMQLLEKAAAEASGYWTAEAKYGKAHTLYFGVAPNGHVGCFYGKSAVSQYGALVIASAHLPKSGVVEIELGKLFPDNVNNYFQRFASAFFIK